MIGIIRISIIRGELTGEEHLRNIASSLFVPENIPPLLTGGQGLERYIRDMTPVYTCVPRAASRASFIWSDAQEFEIVVETLPQGNLIDVTEGMVSRIVTRFKQLNIKSRIRVILQSSSDTQTYMIGEEKSRRSYLWERIHDTVIALVIAVIIALVSKAWFPSYSEESQAACLSLTLLAIYQGWRGWAEAKNRILHWRCHE